MKQFLALFLIATCFIACQSENTEYMESIKGSWVGTAWEVDGKTQANPGAYMFNFSADGTYTSQLGASSQKGEYGIKGNKLSTQVEGQKKVIVEIQELADGKMLWEMNRGGQKELLTLEQKWPNRKNQS